MRGKSHRPDTEHRSIGREEAGRFPECLEFWDNGVITEFPTPYYGFQTVDFVGGHVSFAFGEYTAWLRERGGSRELLKPHVPTSDPGDTSVYSVEMPEELHYNRFIADSTIHSIAGTYGMVTHLDTEIGRVLDALEEHGVCEETVVVFLADHGDMMGDHGLLWKSFYTFEGCIRIPTIVSVPARFGGPGRPGGRQCESLISQIDLLPSILDLCDVPLPGADWTETETPFQRGTEQPLSTYPGRSWASLAGGSREPIFATSSRLSCFPSTRQQRRGSRFRRGTPRMGSGDARSRLMNLVRQSSSRSGCALLGFGRCGGGE